MRKWLCGILLLVAICVVSLVTLDQQFPVSNKFILSPGEEEFVYCVHEYTGMQLLQSKGNSRLILMGGYLADWCFPEPPPRSMFKIVSLKRVDVLEKVVKRPFKAYYIRVQVDPAKEIDAKVVVFCDSAEVAYVNLMEEEPRPFEKIYSREAASPEEVAYWQHQLEIILEMEASRHAMAAK